MKYNGPRENLIVSDLGGDLSGTAAEQVWFIANVFEKCRWWFVDILIGVMKCHGYVRVKKVKHGTFNGGEG